VKRFYVFSLVAVVLLGFTAIASAKDIGVAWVGKSGMANRVNAGLEKGLADKGINIEFSKEMGSTDELGPLFAKWSSEKDGIVLLRSNGAKWLGKNPPSIPTFIGGCNNPVVLGTVKNMDAPGGNITGVTYFIDPDYMLPIFQALLPDMNSIALIVDANNPSAGVDMQSTKAACGKNGITYNEVKVTSKDEAAQKIGELSGKVSAIILGTQALLMDATAELVAAAGNTPVLAYNKKSVSEGALAGFAADDNKLGMMLADIVVDVVINGKPIGSIPVAVDPEPGLYLNEGAAEKFGITIPEELMESIKLVK